MSATSLYLYKRPDGSMWPADEDAQGYLRKIAAGEVIQASVRKARNYAFHKKYFALLKVGFDCQERYTSPEAFRKEVIILAGWSTTHVHIDGTVSFNADSIAFDKMDELEFDKLYQATINVLLQHFVSHMTEDNLRNAAAEDIVRFAS